jgi:uncharacterized protein YacL
MNSKLALRVARLGFLLFGALLGFMMAKSFQVEWWQGALYGVAVAVVGIVVDLMLGRFTISALSSSTIGLLIGIFCAWLLLRINIYDSLWPQGDGSERWRNIISLTVYAFFGFLGITLALRSNREEFALLIPYVRFRQEGFEDQLLLVDTNILIDGRLPGLCETGFLSGTILLPRFVLDELHVLADSLDPIKRERGKRGLECVERLRAIGSVAIRIEEGDKDTIAPVDIRLIKLAQATGARLLSNDTNLGRVAVLQNIKVLNLNQLGRAMKPNLIPGDEIDIALIKEGKDPHQAVGYLPDGTMIVVNHAHDYIGNTMPVTVSSSLQTTAGRLIFGELKGSTAPAVASAPIARPVELGK